MDEAQQAQVTTNYDQFQLIDSNREQNRGHVESLKRAFTEIGNLTKVQPIIVNERMEIIDGQHRYIAAKELGEPIYYTQFEGLTVNDARQMNILHRTWKIDDFARSYAATGNENYAKYLETKEDFGFNHSITLIYINGTDDKGAFKEFRSGDFVFEDRPAAMERLTKLADAGAFVPFVNDRYFAKAFLKAMAIEGYDQKRMLKKIELHQNILKRYASVEDYLRMLEEIYNFQMAESNRLRLY